MKRIKMAAIAAAASMILSAMPINMQVWAQDQTAVTAESYDLVNPIAGTL